MGFILLFIMSITPSRQRDVSAVTADTTEYSTSENSGKKIPPELQLPEGSENATCSTSTSVVLLQIPKTFLKEHLWVDDDGQLYLFR
ncbi:hypothetical protein FOZ60_001170 [Perkinsus olseni]|uniref:Uncharacterized protein n=1 Tax=Perkinsus olseni TaxID=32597 RepID=A0A7J6P0Q4_PEROL|nr:hypothetical protein FOZ60_001170 [Perkinsus olseni]